jgi:hypothetical protein
MKTQQGRICLVRDCKVATLGWPNGDEFVNFLHKKADPCITQGPAHQNKTKNQLFILEDRRNGSVH